MFSQRNFVLRMTLLIWLVAIFGNGFGVWCQTADMSKFSDLVEQDTCNKEPWFKYDKIRSMFATSSYFVVTLEETRTPQVELSNVLFSQYAQSKLLYHLEVKHEGKAIVPRGFQKKTYDEYVDKFHILWYYRLDETDTLWMFDTKGNNDKFVASNLTTKITKIENGKMVDKDTEKGTVPLFEIQTTEYGVRDSYARPSELPVSLINNQKFFYQSAMLNFETAAFRVVHSCYYGFDNDLKNIYFAKEFKQLENIDNFLHPSKVVGDRRWHPFLSNGYIYLPVGDWVFLIPHLNHTDTWSKLENKVNSSNTIIQAPMTVMHRNTFFQCTKSSSNIAIPEYPKAEFTVYEGSDGGGGAGAIIATIIVFIIVLVLGYVVFVIAKRKRSKTNKPKSLSRSKVKSGISSGKTMATSSTSTR